MGRLLAIISVLAGPLAVAQHWLDLPLLDVTPSLWHRFAVDLDGDGDLDLIKHAPAGGGQNAVAVVGFNDGAGSFSYGPPLSFGSNDLDVLFHADVTGDGIPDLVAVSEPNAQPWGAAIAVRPGLGGGGFGAPITSPTPGWANAAAMADVNGDGLADVGAVFSQSGVFEMRWLTANPGGSFSAGPPLATAPLQYLASMVAVDASGDGVPDLVGPNPEGTLLRTYISAGTALTLGPAVPIAPSDLTKVVDADLDGDGDRDLVVTSWNLRVQPFFRQAGGGYVPGTAQSFASAIPFSIGLGAAVHVADWDGDGLPDLLWQASAGDVVPCRGTAAGSWVAATPRRSSGPSPARQGAVGDIDQDGFLDLACGNAIVFGSGSFTLPTRGIPSSGTGLTGTSAALDLDRDGDLDVVHPTGASLNDGRGVFAPLALTVPPPPAGSWAHARPLGDLDGNGRNDWLVRSQIPAPYFPTFVEVRRWELTGTGQLVDRGSAAAPGVLVDAYTTLDADQDGDQDVAGTSLWSKSGTGSFVLAQSFAPWTARAAVDIDGDGDTDLVASGGSGAPATVALLRNTGGVFSFEPYFTGHAAGEAASILVRDLDDDGDPDIAVEDVAYAPTNGNIPILRNDGGTLVLVIALSIPASNPHYRENLAAADIDGDGMTDLCVGSAIYRRSGPGLSYAAPRKFVGLLQAGAFDLDGDGDEDLSSLQAWYENRTHRPPSSGSVRQFGQSSEGPGGFRPVLGGTGPFRVGHPSVLRLRNAYGGATALLAVGAQESNVPLAPGLSSYCEPWLLLLTVPLAGPTGAPGEGSFDLGGIIPPGFAGGSLFWQMAFEAPGTPFGIAVTNGVETHYGS